MSPTPNNIAPGAGFGIRATARIIDAIYGLVVAMVAAFLAGILVAFLEEAGVVAAGWEGARRGLDLPLWGASVVGTLLYQSLTEGMSGASLGKLLCGLRVTSQTVQPIGFTQAFKRSLAFYWDGLFFGLVGYLSMKKSDLNQRYGDHWARTVVAKASDVPPEAKRGGGMFALAFTLGSVAKAICIALGLILCIL